MSVVDRELASESADADLSQDQESAETVPESAEDQDSEQRPQDVPHETGKLGQLVPKVLELVPPRHRWRSFLVAFLRLLFLARSAPQLPASVAAVVAAIWAVVAGLILSLLVAVVAQIEQPITVAPWKRASRASSAPMPEATPVTIKVLFCRFMFKPSCFCIGMGGATR